MVSETQPQRSVQVDPGVVPDDLAHFARDPNASFFQSPAWLRLVATHEPRYRPWVPCVRDASGQLVAALPLFEVRQWGTRRLYAGPWGTYGGILSSDPEATLLLLRWFADQAGSCALVRVHDFRGSLASLEAPWRKVKESSQVVRLKGDATTLFEESFTSQNRNKIRKAEKNDVQVACHADATALQHYADLYASLAQRHAVRDPLSRPLLLGLAECDGVQVWLATRHGAVIAGLLNFRWGGQIMNWGNVSSPDSWKYAPNNLLHWRALEAAAQDEDGPRLYNFGSSAVSEKVHTFKKSFGAEDRSFDRLEHTAAWLDVLHRLRGRSS